MAARIPMMAMTIISSISVKPFVLFFSFDNILASPSRKWLIKGNVKLKHTKPGCKMSKCAISLPGISDKP
jgi:hypothetical protein